MLPQYEKNQDLGNDYSLLVKLLENTYKIHNSFRQRMTTYDSVGYHERNLCFQGYCTAQKIKFLQKYTEADFEKVDVDCLPCAKHGKGVLTK